MGKRQPTTAANGTLKAKASAASANTRSSSLASSKLLMSFDPALFRTMPPVQYGEMMTDPYTGLVIPKTMRRTSRGGRSSSRQPRPPHHPPVDQGGVREVADLLDQRLRLDVPAEESRRWTGTRRRCQRPGSHVPFITWKVQDDAIVELIDAIDNGHDALIHKARDMGASWIVVGVFQWYFQFRPVHDVPGTLP
jgi:hypothetical protein